MCYIYTISVDVCCYHNLSDGFARPQIRIMIQQHSRFFLYPVGFITLKNPQPQSPVRPEYKKRECLLNQHQQSTIYSLLYNKLKTNTMSQWISIEAAAEKYRLEKEYIWLWVEMKKITVSYENDTVSIDDDSIQQFIKRTKLGITSEYIDELEQLCMEKNKTSRLYASLLNMRDQELMAIRGQSSRLDGLWKMVEEQYERLRSFEKNSMSDNAICSNCWIRKICRRLKRIL